MDGRSTGRARLKHAETKSSMGAGALGAGLALLVADRVGTHAAIPILLAGVALHVWGTFEKHRLEIEAGATRLWLAELFYLGRWVLLLALLMYAVVGP